MESAGHCLAARMDSKDEPPTPSPLPPRSRAHWTFERVALSIRPVHTEGQGAQDPWTMPMPSLNRACSSLHPSFSPPPPFHAQADEQASKPLALGGRKVAAKPNMADALDAAVRAPHVLQRLCLER